MLDRKKLKASFDYVLSQEVERILATVPYASHLTENSVEQVKHSHLS
jgi:hypothetical protein